MTVTTPMPKTRLARATAAAACALAVLLTAACGSDATADGATDRPGGARSGDASGFPVTVASGQLGATTDLTIEQEPQRIVSLSPSATETLWAVGAGDQVTAVDDQSDYPRGVPTTKLSGFQPNVEAILGYSPDLVVAADDTDGLVSDLRKAGVPVLLLPPEEPAEPSAGQPLPPVIVVVRLVQTGQAKRAAVAAECPQHDGRGDVGGPGLRLIQA